MKVFIKNKLVSIGGNSSITDENGKPLYVVEGSVFSFTKKKTMYDLQNNVLYVIKNRFFNLFSRKVYIYDGQKELVATINKSKFSLNCKYEIEDCKDTMSIDGKFFSRHSSILRNGEVVGSLTRNFTLVRDAFCLEAEEQDIPFLSALVIGFDNLIDKIQDD